MAGRDNLKPLDDEFVDTLYATAGRPNLRISPRSENHFWRDRLLEFAQIYNASQTAAAIAQKFASGEWTDQNVPMTSEPVRRVFDGYDRTRSVSQASSGGRHQGEFDNRARRRAMTQTVTPTSMSTGINPETLSTLQSNVWTPPESSNFTQGAASLGRRLLGTPFNPTATLMTPETSVPRNISSGQSYVRHTSTASPSTFGLNNPSTTGWIPQGRIPPPPPAPEPTTDISRHYNDDSDVAQTFGDLVVPAKPIGKVHTASTDGSVPEPAVPDAEDMQKAHTFEGQRQPGIGVRAQQAFNWAADEDIDRRRDFTREKAEIKKWIKYIETNHWEGLGKGTKETITRVKQMIKAHEEFEKEHYQTTMRTKIMDPDDIKTCVPRLGGNDNNPPIQLGDVAPEDKMTKLLPQTFRGHPREWKKVNTMWDTPGEMALGFEPKLNTLRPRYIQDLAQDEDEYWRSALGTMPSMQNMSVVENQYYEACKASNRGLDGWVYLENLQGSTFGDRKLFNGETLGNSRRCFASERGVRRAGLEVALRQFQNTENRIAARSQILLVLPTSAKEMDEVKKKTGANRGRVIDLIGLPPNRLGKTQGKNDPQGFIANMAQFWKKQKVMLDYARENIIGFNSSRGVGCKPGYSPPGSKKFVKPPHSIWGPYVWRGVSFEEEHRQDMLRQMRAVKRLFERERKIAPRTLLEQMSNFFDQGYTTIVDTPLHTVDENGHVPPFKITGQRNRDPITNSLREVDMVEMEWIRLILNNSITGEQMLHDLRPRTSLFLLFAERLEGIFNDISSPLFPDKNSEVTVEELIEYMDNMDGPIKRTKFYPYDVKYWLERLAEQGRCRYRDDWRTHGHVSRPVYRYFPEQLIIWKERSKYDIQVFNFPEDMVYAPRFDQDLRTWHEVVQQDPSRPLDDNVKVYFNQLAFRWGRSMRNLEAREKGAWVNDSKMLARDKMRDVLAKFETQYRQLTSGKNLDLASVVRRTLDRPDSDVTEQDALKIIRDGIIDECVRSDSMLWPARAKDYLDTSATAAKTREPIWDWAKPEIRGPVKKFFSLNRWPLEIQTEETQRRIKSGQDVDMQQVWNPVLEDPTPWTYYRPKAKPYGDELVRFRPGHKIYQIGDTPRQKEVVKLEIMAKVGQAMGLMDDTPPEATSSDQGPTGLWGKVKGIFKRKREIIEIEDEDDDDDIIIPPSRLPRLDPELIPKSYDRRAEAEADKGQDDMAGLAKTSSEPHAWRGSSNPDEKGAGASTTLGTRNPDLRIDVSADMGTL